VAGRVAKKMVDKAHSQPVETEDDSVTDIMSILGESCLQLCTFEPRADKISSFTFQSRLTCLKMRMRGLAKAS
jgi:hypothetical protein